MADIDTSPEAVGRLAERVTAIPVLGPTDRQRVAATLRALSSKVARVEACAYLDAIERLETESAALRKDVALLLRKLDRLQLDDPRGSRRDAYEYPDGSEVKAGPVIRRLRKRLGMGPTRIQKMEAKRG